MRPLNNNIQVELVKDKGALVLVSDNYAVCKVLSIPIFDNECNTEVKNIKVGSELLVDYIRDYSNVQGNHLYFIRLQDIVCIL